MQLSVIGRRVDTGDADFLPAQVDRVDVGGGRMEIDQVNAIRAVFSGWRAMLSKAEPARRPMPYAAPITVRPTPNAPPNSIQAS